MNILRAIYLEGRRLDKELSNKEHKESKKED